MKTIWFDLDGCLVDLYRVENWLPKLRAYDPTPYADAAPMLNMNTLARLLNKVQAAGWQIGIISWLSKDPDPDYGVAVTRAKKRWLNMHLTSVSWDEINIVPYGEKKFYFKQTDFDILFDDEEENRNSWSAWGGNSYEPDKIFEILKMILMED